MMVVDDANCISDGATTSGRTTGGWRAIAQMPGASRCLPPRPPPRPGGLDVTSSSGSPNEGGSPRGGRVLRARWNGRDCGFGGSRARPPPAGWLAAQLDALPGAASSNADHRRRREVAGSCASAAIRWRLHRPPNRRGGWQPSRPVATGEARWPPGLGWLRQADWVRGPPRGAGLAVALLPAMDGPRAVDRARLFAARPETATSGLLASLAFPPEALVPRPRS